MISSWQLSSLFSERSSCLGYKTIDSERYETVGKDQWFERFRMRKWTIVAAIVSICAFRLDLLGEGRLPPSGSILRGEQSSHSNDENETTWTRKIFRERNWRNVQDYRLAHSLSLFLSIVHKTDEQTKMPKRMFSFFTFNIDVRLFFPFFSFPFVLSRCVCVFVQTHDIRYLDHMGASFPVTKPRMHRAFLGDKVVTWDISV